MDFIIRLPESEGYNAIMVYINYLTKMRYFILIKNDVTAQDTALLFINNIYL